MMVKYRNILVGVDGSSAGYIALAEAIRLVQWSRGRITALTVRPSYEGDLSLVGVRDIKAVVTGSCATITDRVLKIGAGMQTEIDVSCTVGKPNDEISRRAADGHYDLIVLGCRRRRGIRAWFGSITASAIIRDAVADVLLIREQTAMAWEEMLLVSNNNGNLQYLRRAAELNMAYGGHLRVLLIGDGMITDDGLPPSISQQRIEYLRGRRATPAQIVARAAGSSTSLIILGIHPAGWFDFRQTLYLKRIWHLAPCPALILKGC